MRIAGRLLEDGRLEERRRPGIRARSTTVQRRAFASSRPSGGRSSRSNAHQSFWSPGRQSRVAPRTTAASRHASRTGAIAGVAASSASRISTVGRARRLATTTRGQLADRDAVQEPGALGPGLGSGRAVGEDELAARVEALGEPEQAEPERLDVRHVDGLRSAGGDVPQEVRLPRPDRAHQERVAPPRDVREEARALGRAADHRQLRRERSQASAPADAGTGARRR